jgi:hypothetical protein
MRKVEFLRRHKILGVDSSFDELRETDAEIEKTKQQLFIPK